MYDYMKYSTWFWFTVTILLLFVEPYSLAFWSCFIIANVHGVGRVVLAELKTIQEKMKND